ncbi:MAG: hypothetical protein CM15mP100_0100 [Alphaproteobacteria bacterium]|nr:MAG: hypothetical protein CM15mP100_0100 [Alphaproteobacteria bacterium]
MASNNIKTKTTGLIIFVIIFIFFSTLNAKNLDKYNTSSKISDYLSGSILLSQSKYSDSYKYLKKLDGLEENHSKFSSKYLYATVNSGNFNQAFNFSKKLEKKKQDTFESDLIIGIYHMKNFKFDLANQYFLKAKNRKSKSILDTYVANSLNFWSQLDNYNFNEANLIFDQLDDRLMNLKKIQNVFLNCFYGNEKVEKLFSDLTSDKNIDFSRYNYFFAKYLENNNKKKESKQIIEKSLKLYPKNLLLNQFKLDQENSKNHFDFNCKNKNHVIAEIIYIASNALSSQDFYQLSNFYLNLAKYLNSNFQIFDTLMAENFYNINDYKKAKEIYLRLTKFGETFKWYSNKQISRILILEEKKEKSLQLLSRAYNDLKFKGVYETFDYAQFLKNNEEFEKSVKYYTDILNIIDTNHPIFAEVKDGRGVAYERIGNWEKAEKDLLASLEKNPNQAYVINYLAYSWIEKGIKIEKSLEMLEKANELRSNDPYIIDSLGWALFKLKRYKESKDYLQLAVKLMPADPIVNDHYGDVLWKNGNEIQARYYWNYVLNLKKTELQLKQKIETKLITGL